MQIGMTGGTGFIGSFLFDHLKNEYSVKRTVRRKPTSGDEIYCSDIGNTEELRPFLENSDVLIHLANENRPRDTAASISEDLTRNLLKTLNLFEAFYRIKPQGHILYFSTGGALYAPKQQRSPFVETDAVDPTTSYGIQKFAAENFLRMLCQNGQGSATTFRVSNPYGTPLSTQRTQGLIGVAVACARKQKEFHLFGNINLVRDYLHLSDLTSAVRCIIAEPKVPKEFSTYNIGSGTGHTTAEVIDLINRYSPNPLQVIYDPETVNEAPWNILDIGLFKSKFSWAPKINLEQGISQMLID